MSVRCLIWIVKSRLFLWIGMVLVMSSVYEQSNCKLLIKGIPGLSYIFFLSNLHLHYLAGQINLTEICLFFFLSPLVEVDNRSVKQTKHHNEVQVEGRGEKNESQQPQNNDSFHLLPRSHVSFKIPNHRQEKNGARCLTRKMLSVVA